jgi:hypothetical protein
MLSPIRRRGGIDKIGPATIKEEVIVVDFIEKN